MKKTENEMKLLRERYPSFPPEYMPTTRNKKSPTNELTKKIVDFIKLKMGFCARVNSQGQYNPKLKQWTKSGSTKGAADLSCVVCGKSIQVEVKAGKGDKQRTAQAVFQKQIEMAGGQYLIVKTYEDFLNQFEQLNLKQ